MGQAANALTQARAGSDMFFSSALSRSSRQPIREKTRAG